MTAFQINDAEWAALVEEPGDIFLAYCAIRRVMDYSTGVAGQARKISEQMLREVLYVAPCRGRHESGSPTRQRVRSVVDRLITLGALVQVGPLVFQLPLATRDSPSKRSPTDEQPDQQPDQQPYQQPIGNKQKVSKDAASSDEGMESATGSGSGDALISNLPPVSVNPMVMFPREGHFSMPLDGWEPIQKTFKAIAFKNAVPVTALTPERLSAFCSYWHVRLEKEQTQAQWEYQLVDHLKKQIQFAANSEGKANGHKRSEEASTRRATGKRSLSAVERVERAIQRNREERAKASGAPAHGAVGEALDDNGGDLRAPLDGEFWRESEG